MGAIAATFADELVGSLAGGKIEVNAEETMLDKLAADGFDSVHGAGPLRRDVERQPENPLARKIVASESPDGSKVRGHRRDGMIVFEPTA